jgi:hypothetical protein
MTLTIWADDDTKIAVSEAQAPDLFTAWTSWQKAERGSSKEAQRWCNVLAEAGVVLDETDATEGLEVIDVAEAA